MNHSSISFVLCSFAVVGAIMLAQTQQAHAQGDDLRVMETPSQTKVNLEPRELTASEVRLLQELDERRVELDRREKSLELREKLVDLAEKRLSGRTQEMSILKTQLEELLKSLSGKEEEELLELARIYEVMKAEAAANVLNRIDNKIVFDIFKRMKRKNTAAIMEKMDTGKARIISEMLAEKTALPSLN